MDELLGAHVDAPGGVDRHQGLGLPTDLPGQDHLLDVAPGQGARRRAGGGTADVEALLEHLGIAVDGLAPQEGHLAEAGLGEVLEDEVVLHRERRDDAFRLPVLGHVAHAGLDDLPGGAVRQVLVLEEHLPGLHRPQARQGVSKLALAIAGDAGHAEDLTSPQLQVEAVQHQVAPVTPDAEVPHREEGLTLGAAAFVAGQDHVVARHEGGQLRGLVVGRLAVEDHGAMAQDRHPVGEGLYFVELVADEDDGQLRGHALEPLDEVIGLLGRQG